MQPKPRRPTGVTILGVLAILGGIALLVAGVAAIGLGLVIGTYAGSAFTNALSNAGYSGLASIGAGVLVLGILYFAVGIGYFGGKGWAWTVGIIVTAISIVLDIIQIAFGAYSNAFGLVIGLLIIYYLTRPHVKVFFGKGGSTIASPMPTQG